MFIDPREFDAFLELSLKEILTEGDATTATKALLEHGVFTPRDIKELGVLLKKCKGVNVEEGGNGTVWLSSLLEFEEVVKEFEGKLVSPSAAAKNLGVSRARIHQMEMEGKIRVYRVKADFFEGDEFWKDFNKASFWVRAMIKEFSPRRFIYIPSLDLDLYNQQHQMEHEF
jgi:hypothetical protein